MPDGAIYRILLDGEELLPGTPERIVGIVVIDAPARSALSVIYLSSGGRGLDARGITLASKLYL